jgi:hypothetical protein
MENTKNDHAYGMSVNLLPPKLKQNLAKKCPW